jgi:hypothetical protein
VPAFCDGQHVSLEVVADDVSNIRWSGPLGYAASGSAVTIEYISSIQQGWYVATGEANAGCAVIDSVYVEVGSGICAEICDNGIDDDGDGLVDCDDPDCSCCGLENVTFRTECIDGGTPDDITDDKYAVYATLHGSGIHGKAFAVSGDITIPQIFAGGEVLLGKFPIAQAEISVSFIGIDDPTCKLLEQKASSPGVCTDNCVLQIVNTEVSECTDGQYDLYVTVLYANPAGPLRINGKQFSLPSGYGQLTFTLPNLSCTGDQDVMIEAYFENQHACFDTEKYDAPCPDEVCAPIEIQVGN